MRDQVGRSSDWVRSSTAAVSVRKDGGVAASLPITEATTMAMHVFLFVRSLTQRMLIYRSGR